MVLPVAGPGGGPLGPGHLAEGARRLEAAGFDSVWAFDAIGRGFALPDALIAVSVAAAVTTSVEVGTGVLQVPLRNPVELANRVLTAHLVSGGRLVLGVGAGSTRADFDAVGADFDGRLRALDEGLTTMRRLWAGESVASARLTPWPAAVGGPPVLVGSWAGSRWITRAATELDGWVASAAKTSVRALREGIARFRDAGGTRAVVTNIEVDLAAPRTPLGDEDPLTLRCPPDEAAARLALLADLGFDDAVLFAMDHGDEALATLRSLTTTPAEPARRTGERTCSST